MQKAYLLQHLHVLAHGEDDVKIIGIYSSKEAAQAVAYRLKTHSGFRNFPNIVNSKSDEQPDGFYIDEYIVDQDHWKEGFETL
jgi:predicted HNH restriction endonuclease